MKRVKFLSMAVTAALAILALAATSALAANPTLLPNGGESASTSGATVFGSGITQVKSSKDTGTAKSTTEKLGTFTNVFEGSKDVLGRTCTGLEDKTAGNVTVTGEYHVRYWGLSKGEKNVAIVFLLNPVHFSCGTTLIKVKGCVAGQVAAAETNKLLKKLEVKLVVKEGDNVPIKIDNDANTAEENCELKAEVNDEAVALSSEEGTETLTFKNALGKAKDEGEIMA